MKKGWNKIPKEFLWGIAVLVVLTIPFWISKLDLCLIRGFYHPELPYPWNLRSRYPWNLLYYFGSYPGAILGLLSLVVFILTFIRPDFYQRRKMALFVLTALVIGPGLIVNGIFKEHYGRPRPREIREFGGNQDYLPVWIPDFSNQGKSFPCGHCSMGFYFIVLYYLWKKKRKWLSRLALFFSMVFGVTIGIARMGQGGHFPSDVLWSGGLVFLVTTFLYYYVFHLDREEEESILQGKPSFQIPKKIAFPLIGLGVILLLASFLVATPLYLDSRMMIDHHVRTLELHGEQGDVQIKGGESNAEIVFHTEGFGFPGNTYLIGKVPLDTAGIKVEYHIKGIHTEAKSTLIITSGSVRNLFLNIQDSHVKIDSTATIQHYTIQFQQGSLTIDGIAYAQLPITLTIQAPGRKFRMRGIHAPVQIQITEGKLSGVQNKDIPRQFVVESESFEAVLDSVMMMQIQVPE